MIEIAHLVASISRSVASFSALWPTSPSVSSSHFVRSLLGIRYFLFSGLCRLLLLCPPILSMVTFAYVQTAFRTGNTEDFKCIAPKHRGGPCTTSLTDGQKTKLRELLNKEKHDLAVEDIRIIIWKLLCTYHQDKKEYYENAIERSWRDEFSHLNFSTPRKPSRRSDPSRSGSPDAERVLNSPSSASHTGVPTFEDSGEQTLHAHSPCHTPKCKKRTGETEHLFTPTLHEGNKFSPCIPRADDVVQSVEGDSPSRGRSPPIHSQISESLLPLDEDNVQDRSTDFTCKSAAIEDEDTEVQQASGHSNGASSVSADIFQSDSEDKRAADFDFECPDPKMTSGLLDHERGDSISEVVREPSNRWFRGVLLDSRGVLSTEKPTHLDKVDDSVRNTPEDPVRPKTPESQTNHHDERETATPADHDRSSLSPDDGRRPSRYEKSPSQSRSPSTPPTTDRAKLAYGTMKRDASYDRPPKVNEQSVADLLRKPLRYTKDGKLGWLYAIRDPDLELVKIGLTTAIRPETRLRGLCSSCKLSNDAYLIKDPDRVAVLAYQRLEDLIHADLAPHRWYYDCACGLKRGKGLYPTEHHEWYELSDEIAVQTIRVWRDFILQKPYGILQTGKLHHLQVKWAERIQNRAKVTSEETHEDHETRLRRWRTIFQDYSEDAADSSSRKGQREEPPEMPEEVGIKKEEQSIQPLESIPAFEGDMPSVDLPQASPPKPDIQINGEHWSVPTTRRSSTGTFTRELEAGMLNSVGGQYGLTEVLSTLKIGLRKERKGLRYRTIHSDLIQFRWPLACTIALVLHAPYAPPMLSMLLWIVFLPLFMAEMREWLPPGMSGYQEAHRKIPS